MEGIQKFYVINKIQTNCYKLQAGFVTDHIYVIYCVCQYMYM